MNERGLDQDRLRILAAAAQPFATYRGITQGHNAYRLLDLAWLRKNGYVEAWRAMLDKALWRGSCLMLDSLGIPTANLPRPTGWGTVLAMLTGEAD